jgi:hypothetical protein
MRRIFLPVILATVSLALLFEHQSGAGCRFLPEDFNTLAKDAVSENHGTAEHAIGVLRAAGPKGLEALLDVHSEQLRRHAADSMLAPKSSTVAATPALSVSTKPATGPSTVTDSDEQQWTRLRTALDEVGGQRDCHTSRLFWYTDFEAAKAAARREGKPILSLRLLGQLTDEYSCANSRFFRATLYSNPAISQLLRDRFVLHWKSVRPAPKVTIDFGDGRKLQRTITGNSIHYVLDSEGRVIDALPGLYGPQVFLRELQRDADTAKQVASLTAEQREKFLQDFHHGRVAAIETAWQQDLQKLGVRVESSAANERVAIHSKANSAGGDHFTATQTAAVQPTASAAPRAPSAAMAGMYAVSKGFVEMPLVRAIAISPTDRLKQATTDDVWNRIAQLHAAEAVLDPASIALIRSQNPTAAKAAPRAVTKSVVESPLLRMVRNFQGTIALDTVQNEYLFHDVIHQWLSAVPTPPLDAFNERVYSELFLTPSSDPWLGLMPADTYSGLANNGVEK